MNHYKILSARYTVADGGMACGPVSGAVIAEAAFEKPEGEVFFLTCVESMGIPTFVMTEKSVFDRIVSAEESGNEDDDLSDVLDGHTIDVGEYPDIFEDKDPKYYDMLRYIIFIVGNDCDEVDAFIKETTGKYLDEIDIPVSAIEEGYMEDDDDDDYDLEDDDDDDLEDDDVEISLPTDKETLYRARLSVETDLETESVYKDMDASAVRKEEKVLAALIDACGDDYEDWKQDYLDREYEKVKDKKFLVCGYLFAGIGQYKATIPEEALPSFQCWINGNGSAFFGSSREATKEEVIKYLALHADEK